MADIREEDFTRLQAQIIELRTSNYDIEVKFQRQNNDLEQLKEKNTQLEKELEKSNKIIQRSKNKKEYALLLDENEGLQHQLRDHEEDFKLQNKTLIEEVTRIEDENKKFLEEIKNLKLGKDGDVGSSHEAELRRLKAENAALQKSLKSAHSLQEAEEKKVQENDQEDSQQTAKSVDCQRSDEKDSSERIQERCSGNELTETTNEKQKHSIENEIGDKLVKLVDSVFGTFCGKLSEHSPTSIETETCENTDVVLPQECSSNDKETAHIENSHARSEDIESTDNDKQEISENKDSLTKNNEKTHSARSTQVESHSFYFSDKDFRSLKEHMLTKLLSLLKETDVFKPMKEEKTTENTESKGDEGMAFKHSRQLTELQLNLATEREEKKLLEEQLLNLEGNLKKEISKLEEEVEKLTEKAKRKQESFTQLQEEKERLYNENRKTIDEMKQFHSSELKAFADQVTQLTHDLEANKKELVEVRKLSDDKIKELNEKLVVQENQATSNVEETIQELDNARIENSSLCEQLQSLQEACESYRRENEDQKAMLIGLQEKIKDSEKREMTLKGDNEKLKTELQECSLSYEHLRRQVDEMMSEKEQYLQSTNEATKLAEKRKQMLDEFSISQQKTVTEHKEQIENLEASYKEAAKKSQDEYKKTIEDLKAQLQGEKKLKKELEEKQQKLLDVSTQLSSVESKSGWFERRLTETEEILNQEREKARETLEDLKKEHDINVNEMSTKHSAEVEELNEKISIMETEKQAQVNLIEKFKQEIKDKDVENVIAGKKGDHLVKDLKRQLKSERKKNEQLQQRLQEAASESRARENFDRIFDPNVSRENARRNSGDSSMLSGSSLTNDNQDYKEPSPDSSFNVSINDETVDLIARVAELQQEKWQLEERVRHLEENCSAMANDLMQKTAVIQHYAMETKLDAAKDVVNVTESNFKSRVKGTFNLGKQEELLKDMNKKLQRMLEETLMKNIQLQKDLDMLSKQHTSVNDGPSMKTDDSSTR